jgi:hypothetical protein
MRLPKPLKPDGSGTPMIAWGIAGVPQPCGFPTDSVCSLTDP